MVRRSKSLERVLLPVDPELPEGADLDAACVLRGFSLETAGAPRTTRGFGFRLIDPVLDGRLFTFRPEYQLRPEEGADYDFTASIAYSVILSRVIARLGTALSLLAGIVFGLLLYGINMYGFTALFPWFEATRDWITVIAHVVFGIVAAAVYKLLSKRSLASA